MLRIYYGSLCVLLCTAHFKAVIAASKEGRQLEFSENSSKFAMDLYLAIEKTNSNKNFVISPFSVQVCGAMLYYGAGGQTANELAKGIRLPENDKDKVASFFHIALQDHKSFLDIANKIYLKNGLQVDSHFRQIVSQNFFSEEENLDFSQGSHPEKAVNSWVANVTHDKIKDLLSENSLDPDTIIFLVNAMLFKGEWEHHFRKGLRKGFWFSENEYQLVDSLWHAENHKYGEISFLDSTALEMKYKASDISVLIILPNKRTGLEELEQKLSSLDLLQISNQLKESKVNVEMPKFKIEFSVDLKEALSKMGISSMFSNDADFGQMLPDKKSKIDKAIHKAFIAVNERGTEEGAPGPVPIELSNTVNFFVEHPFFFAIKSKTAVLFVGRYTHVK